MCRWVAAIVLVTALAPAGAGEPPRTVERPQDKVERPHEWIAIAYFRSTSSGDIVSSELAIFATETDCRRWVRHRANSDFWRVWNVSTPDCISQEVSMMT
jgi:hypothetical protein